MKFKELIIKNFQSFADEEQVLDLSNDDITLITGFNEITNSSNGSGKSSLINAIIFCLYGKTKDSIDNVVNKYTGKKNCKVEVILEKNKDIYSIIR
jgi:DNA repair exonuclease SbcCD ATPase subunit